jgi:hypothetical protein
MKRIQLTTNLYLDEYIPEELYKKYIGGEHKLMGMLDERVVKSDQMLRNHFGKVTINNWIHHGPRNWSGLRTEDSPDFSFASQHTFGRASDKLFANATADEVREYIRKKYILLGITCIEDAVGWVHSDVRYLKSSDLLIVYPKKVG